MKLTAELLNAALFGYEYRKAEIDNRIAYIKAELGNGASGKRKPPERELGASEAAPPMRQRRELSASARRRMAAAQRRRWVNYRKAQKAA